MRVWTYPGPPGTVVGALSFPYDVGAPRSFAGARRSLLVPHP